MASISGFMSLFCSMRSMSGGRGQAGLVAKRQGGRIMEQHTGDIVVEDVIFLDDIVNDSLGIFVEY